jgi:hypothetical protein
MCKRLNPTKGRNTFTADHSTRRRRDNSEFVRSEVTAAVTHVNGDLLSYNGVRCTGSTQSTRNQISEYRNFEISRWRTLLNVNDLPHASAMKMEAADSSKTCIYSPKSMWSSPRTLISKRLLVERELFGSYRRPLQHTHSAHIRRRSGYSLVVTSRVSLSDPEDGSDMLLPACRLCKTKH